MESAPARLKLLAYLLVLPLLVAGAWVTVKSGMALWAKRSALNTVAKAPDERPPQSALGPTPASPASPDCTVRLAKEPGSFAMQCSCDDLWGAILSKQGNWLLLPLYEAACGALEKASEASTKP